MYFLCFLEPLFSFEDPHKDMNSLKQFDREEVLKEHLFEAQMAGDPYCR